jgi:RNA polymerase sigma-70 factor (ECF subfamily)
VEDNRAMELDRLIRAHGDDLMRICFVYLKDLHLAQDAVQDAFLKAFRKLSDIQSREEPEKKAWLMRIAVNTCKDYRRSAWWRRVDRRVTPEDLPETASTQPEDETDVLSEVMRLPLPLRQAILMTYYLNMDADTASKALGISRASYYRRLKKARETLKLHAERWYSHA